VCLNLIISNRVFIAWFCTGRWICFCNAIITWYQNSL
jgi:hypothetical protein